MTSDKRIKDRLNFLTAGMPLRTKPSEYEQAFRVLEEMDLDGLELEFVRGVRVSEKSKVSIKKAAQDFLITAHGPYYINLNSNEQEKIDASVVRIVDTALMAHELGAFSITYHAAFYMGADKKTVFDKVVQETKKIIEVVEKENICVWIRPETTGKPTQWGDLDEIIALSKEFKQVLPCVDFSHLHARTGGAMNEYKDFCNTLERIGNEIGAHALENFHGHLAGIAYSEKGEKNHLELENSDMNYKDLLKALKEFGVKGALVCESPNIEEDCKLIKEYYLGI